MRGILEPLWRSLFARVAATFAIILLFVELCSVAASFALKYAEVRDRLEAQGRTLAQVVAQSSRAAVFAENPELLKDLVTSVLREEKVVGISVFTLRGAQLISRQRAHSNGRKTMLISEPVEIEVLANAAESSYFDAEAVEKSHRTIGRVEVLMDRAVMSEELEAALLADAIILIVSLLLGLLMISMLVRGISRPLRALTEAVSVFGERGEAMELAVVHDDEVGELTRAFGRMAASLRRREAEKLILESKLREAEKMDAVGRLSSGIAHDFNNIISVATGSLRIMERSLPSEGVVRREAARIGDAMKRARGLVQQMLTYSRAGLVESEEIELNALLTRLEPVLTGVCAEEYELRLNLREGELFVQGNPSQLEQVILNLVANACDAMPGGGRVEVSTGSRLIAGEGVWDGDVPRGEYVVLSVEDSGIGIDRALQSKVLEPFFSTKGVGKGTGLGLTMVYGIVKQHGGYLRIDSKVGRGTRVTVLFPQVGTEVAGN